MSLGVGMGLQLGWARHGGAAKRRWGRLGDGWLVGMLERAWGGVCIKAEQKGMISNNKTERTNHPPPE